MLMLLCGLLVAGKVRAVDLPVAILGQNVGLDRQDIRVLYQDREGLVWAGTNTGLYLFDGVGFVRMDGTQGFKAAAVAGIVEDADGDLWVATQAGMQVRHQGRFATIEPSEQSLVADPGQTLATQADGRVWVVSHRRLLSVTRQAGADWVEQPAFSRQQREQDPALNQIGVVAAQGDALWFSCGDELCRLEKGQVEHFGAREGVPADAWQHILPAHDGSLWLQGRHALLQRAAGAPAFVEQHLPAGQTWLAGAGDLLTENAHGDIIIATKTGLLRREGTDWKFYGDRAGLLPLPIQPISAVLADRDGSIWMGNPGSGLLHWTANRAIRTWSAWAGWDGSEPTALRQVDARTLWTPDDHNPSVASGDQRNQRWPLTALPPGQAHTDRTAPDGTLWRFHFDGRITRRKQGEGHFSTVARLKNYIRGVKTSRSGEFWIYTQDGVVTLNPATSVVILSPTATATSQNRGFYPGSSCYDIAEDPAGHMWAACNNGIYRYDGQWRYVLVTPTNSAVGYDKIAITSDGTLWAATMHAQLLVGKVTTSDVLPMQPVDSGMLNKITRLDFLATDRRGWLWAGSSTGVDVFDGTRWTHLGARDGLLLDESGANAFLADNDGSVWINSKSGLTHLIDPPRLLASRTWRVKVIAARYGDDDLLPEPSARFVPDTDRVVSLHLAVLGNSTANPVRFRYRLVGMDKEWRETTDSTMHYSPTGPGTFRFQVQAVDVNQGRSSAPVEWTFVLSAPWWHLPWTMLLALFILIAAIVLVWHLRTRALLARQRQLEQTVGRRTAQLKLALHERNNLLAGISHDLRSPLTNIIECVSLWREGDARRDYPHIIEQSIWQQIGLIDDLLEFAQNEHASAELVEDVGYLHAFLAEVVAQAALMAERGANQFVPRFDDRLPALIKADFRHLRQVLLNLLGNAAKFTHQGLVEFEVATEARDEARVRLCFTIRDNGIGIGTDTVESLMEPFVRGRNVEQREGKGLGLSIAAQWLERMGSRLRARQPASGGSEFFFVVDFAAASESEVDSCLLDDDPMDASVDGGGQSIVVVDDDPPARDMLCDLLDSYGFASFPAADGYEALKLVEEQHPAMVITDQSMNDMDGWMLLQALRKIHPDLPVILCSSSPPRRPATCAPELDFDSALLKPVSVHQLLQRVVDALSGAR